MSNTIDSILAAHRQKHQQEETPPDDAPEQFFCIVKVEGMTTDFLEIRFRNGAIFFLNYSELSFFNYSPAGIIDMIFGGFRVEIHGRGLAPKLVEAIKAKRVAWVREADADMEEGMDYKSFVREIFVEFPQGFGEEEEGGQE